MHLMLVNVDGQAFHCPADTRQALKKVRALIAYISVYGKPPSETSSYTLASILLLQVPYHECVPSIDLNSSMTANSFLQGV
jgi:hypothetical protein